MVTRRRAIAVALALLALFAVVLFWPTRERRVKRQMKAVASWISKGEGEGALRMAQRASEAPDYFADPCTVRAEAYGVEGSFSPQNLSRYALGAWSHLSRLEVKLYDLRVVFPDDSRAEVTATARVAGSGPEGDAFNETHEIRCILVHSDGRWRLRKAELVQVLER